LSGRLSNYKIRAMAANRDSAESGVRNCTKESFLVGERNFLGAVRTYHVVGKPKASGDFFQIHSNPRLFTLQDVRRKRALLTDTPV